MTEKLPGGCEHHTGQNQKPERRVLDGRRSSFISVAERHGKERGSAQTEHICDAGNDNNNRKTQSDGAERLRARSRDPPDIDSVHNAVQEIQDLRDQHRQRRLQYIPCDLPVLKINLLHTIPVPDTLPDHSDSLASTAGAVIYL